MPPEHPTELRIAEVLGEHVRREGSYVALARAISAVNGIKKGATDAVDRRKLQRIVERKQPLVLSLQELLALDRYLEPFGEGLAYNPLFRRPNILQTIASAGRPVTFLLGSRPIANSRLQLDHWDVNALAEIQRGINNFAPHVRFDIRDVLLHDDVEDARRSVKSGKWTALLDDDGPSLVCLGSSRATHAAELILARMFEIPPFDDAPEHKAVLPFHFAWPPGLDHVFPSAFRYTAAELATVDAKSAKTVEDKAASALESEGTVHLDELKQRGDGKSYGVCVAQRRKRGQIWLVLAGVTGPATYAAARLADRLGLHLPDKPSKVFWTAVRASVQRDQTRPGSFLAVKDQEVLGGPQPWKPRA